MKLSNNTQKIIKNAVDVASTLGIESIVIDAFSLRGENKELGIAIIMPTAGVDLEFDALGIGEVGTLKNRLKLLESGALSVEYKDSVNPDELMVSMLSLKEGRTTADYKCHDAKLISAPKSINDPTAYEMQFADADVSRIIKGIGSMNSTSIHFSTLNGALLAKISDTRGDMFTHELETTFTALLDDSGELSKSYKSKTLAVIFNNYIRKDDNTSLPVSITKRGVMRITVLDMNIYIFPER